MDGAESPTTKWTELKGGAYIYKTWFLIFLSECSGKSNDTKSRLD